MWKNVRSMKYEFNVAKHMLEKNETRIPVQSKEEEEQWRKNDPIARFRLWLLAKGWLDDVADKAQIEALRQEWGLAD
jgi:TPP-dependent pyruvate/acetoin dehydrogenase alpha subunit